jgi:hypothetical protein
VRITLLHSSLPSSPRLSHKKTVGPCCLPQNLVVPLPALGKKGGAVTADSPCSCTAESRDCRARSSLHVGDRYPIASKRSCCSTFCSDERFQLTGVLFPPLPQVPVHHLSSTLVVASSHIPRVCWRHPYPVHTLAPFNSLLLILHTFAPPLCDAVGGEFYYLVLRMQNPCRRQALITLGANATTCRRQPNMYMLVSILCEAHANT